MYYHDLSYLEFKEREKNNFDHPDSFDFDLLYNHINYILNNKKAKIPIYDYKTHTRTNKFKIIKKTNIILIEGILTFYDKKIRDMLDLKCFLDKPTSIRKELRLKRDINARARTIESIQKQYTQTVEPMYMKYIENTKKYANLIIKEDTVVNSNAFGILCEEINKFLK